MSHAASARIFTTGLALPSETSTTYISVSSRTRRLVGVLLPLTSYIGSFTFHVALGERFLAHLIFPEETL